MNNQLIYGMMQKLAKKFKDTTGLIKSLAIDYQMVVTDIGRKILWGPITATNLYRMVRLPSEANLTAGTEVVVALNTDATSSIQVYSATTDKLLAVIKPGGKTSIGFASAGSYALYEKATLDTTGYYERLDLFPADAKLSLDARAHAPAWAKMSKEVFVYCISNLSQFVKWDVTNSIFRAGAITGMSYSVGSPNVGGSPPSFKVCRITDTQAVAITYGGYFNAYDYPYWAAAGLSVANLTVNSDGVAPSGVYATNVNLGFFQFDGTSLTANTGAAPGFYQGFLGLEITSGSSSTFFISYQMYSGNTRVGRWSISGSALTNTHNNDIPGVVQIKIAAFDGQYCLLVYIESSKLRARVWDATGAVLGSLIDISTLTTGHAPLAIALSSTKAVITYKDSVSPNVFKQRVVTRSGTTLTAETAYTTPEAITDLQFESATAYTATGVGSFSYPLGATNMTTLSVYDVTGGTTIGLRAESKIGTSATSRAARINGRHQSMWPRDVGVSPKQYYFFASTDNVRLSTANNALIRQITETGGAITAETSGLGFGGPVQNV